MATKEIPFATRAEIRERYRAGSRPAHLSSEYGLTQCEISRIIKPQDREAHEMNKSGYKVQDTTTRKRRYTLDCTYFDSIDTEQKAYFFGLLCADGCISRQGYLVTITLQDRDKGLLERFNEALNFSRPLKKLEAAKLRLAKQDQWRLDISSRHMVMALAEKGCMWNKTQNLIFPHIRPDLLHHFVRGYFDGNGSFVIYQQKDHNVPSYQWSISSTNAFNASLAEILRDECGVTHHMEDRNGTNGAIYVNGRFQVARVCEWMYEGATVWLPRKRAKYEEMLEVGAGIATSWPTSAHPLVSQS